MMDVVISRQQSTLNPDAPIFVPDDTVLMEDLFDYLIQVEKEKEFEKELISMGMLKRKKDRGAAKAPRFIEKAPKIVNVKMSPRPIQQPRY